VSTTVAAAERSTAFPDIGPRRIAITGATGFLGSALVDFFSGAGHELLRLTRHPSSAPGKARDVAWDPARGELDPRALEGVDVVIHLAGASVSERWTESHKRAIRDSRVQGTSLVARTIAGLAKRPSVLVSASATGYYGDGGDRVLEEASPSGRDFLAGIAREWEASTRPAEDADIRVVHTRLGLLLSPHGGALAKMLPPFKLGGGGKMGSGQQWMSWIALDDAVGAIEHLAFTESARGAYNVVAPNPVRNEEFAHALGHALGRPAIVPVPGFALRLLFGEMAEAMLLAGQRASSAKLEASGYRFRFPTLEAALRHELSRG
jgi:uncharacterized protein (TIGR01777 family)